MIFLALFVEYFLLFSLSHFAAYTLKHVAQKQIDFIFTGASCIFIKYYTWFCLKRFPADFIWTVFPHFLQNAM